MSAVAILPSIVYGVPEGVRLLVNGREQTVSRSEQAERVIGFLKEHKDEWWCDDCIVKALKALYATKPYNAETTTKVLPSCCSDYQWKSGACPKCGHKKKLTVYCPVTRP